MNTTKPENGERADGRRKTRRIRRKDGNKHCKNILKLPDDITVKIFCKIPIKTLIQCKCVCKSWRQSLSDPKFTKSLSSQAPACVFFEYIDRQRSISYRDKHILVDVSLLSNRKERVSIPNDMVLKLSHPNALYNHPHTRVIGSCNGFLCVKRFNRKTTIFNITNPITGESIPLPVEEETRPSAPTPCHVGFGFSNDVYKVVVFRTSYRREGLEVMVLTVGSGIWRRIGKVNVEVETDYGVLHDGFLHWICKKYKRSGSLFIRAFDVATERFKDIPLPPYTFKNCYETELHIGVLQGSLSITFGSTDTLCVWIMKEHGVAKSWTKELDIEDVRDLINSTFSPMVRGHIYIYSPQSLQVLKFLDKGEVLLFNNATSCLYSYTPATKNLLRVQVDGSFEVKVVATVHVPSFVSPKDIIRNYISMHPEEGVGTSSTIDEVSDIQMPAWTTSVAGWGENEEESELLEIPRGRPTPCLPLPEDLKYVSSATATSLIDMISGLDALLLSKCMAGKDQIQKLRKDNEDLRARARLRLERKISVQMILYHMALILIPFMSYLALK